MISMPYVIELIVRKLEYFHLAQNMFGKQAYSWYWIGIEFSGIK